jgi:UDP-N-acetylmuramyl pentapeptide phosphotransferase/UDP-N-acetylglucosamine-1-phosphate transferase
MGDALFAFAVSFFACAAIVRAERTLAIGLDAGGGGPQKFHAGAVPRVGGIAMLAGIASVPLFLPSREAAFLLTLLLAAAAPAFIGGLAEDITRRVSPAQRLYAAFAAAALGFLLLDARVTDLEIPGTGPLLGFALCSFLFTLLTVAGFSHALNIVDGFNGLSSMVVLLMLVGLGVVAYQVNDEPVLAAALVIGGAVLGFLAWNYPKGLIFAGDGGAYLLGFLTAELAVLLAHRNSEVSAWFPAVLLLYPVVETVFSIYRKKVLRGQSPGEPDGIHLHMLIHKRLVRQPRGAKWKMNALTTPYLVALSALTVLPGAVFWSHTLALIVIVIGFIAVYLWLYWAIVRFKTPKFMVLRRARFAPEHAQGEAEAKLGQEGI